MTASTLLSELARARVVADDALPQAVVAMHSEADIRDDEAGAVHRLTLVYPGEEAGDPKSVSALTPLGTALIGLSQGDSIQWSTATGDRRCITVLRVLGWSGDHGRV